MNSRKLIEGSGKLSGGRFRAITPRKGSWADQEAARPRQPITPEEERMRRAGRAHPVMQSPQARADSAKAATFRRGLGLGKATYYPDLSPEDNERIQRRGWGFVKEAGGWGPSPEHPRQFVKVTLADGNSFQTSINGTEEEVRAYYGIGKEFNMGPKGDSDDDMQKVAKIEFPDGVVAAVSEATSASLFSEIQAAGIEHDHHESDLYVPDTPEVRAILRRHPKEAGGAKPFKHQGNGQTWLDVPFAYLPWWEKRQERGGGVDDYGEQVGPEGRRRFATCEPGQGGGDPDDCPKPQSTTGIILGRRGYDKWAADMLDRDMAVPSWEEGAPYGEESATPHAVVSRMLEAEGEERWDWAPADGPAKWDTPPPHQPFGGWRKAFPDFRPADMPKEILQAVESGGLVDVSKPGGGSPAFALPEAWGPDTSIMFNHTFPSVLYVQAADPIRRDEPELKRFYVVSGDDAIGPTTDDVGQALAELRDEAEQGRGLDPEGGPAGADEGPTGDEALREGAAKVVDTLLEEAEGEDGMDTFLMTDQPATCPKCGRRIVTWISGEGGPKQVVKCEPCNYTFRLEADDDEG